MKDAKDNKTKDTEAKEKAKPTEPAVVKSPPAHPKLTGKEPHAISDWELASRLSYFLWSSMPDDELFRLALEVTASATYSKHKPAGCARRQGPRWSRTSQCSGCSFLT